MTPSRFEHLLSLIQHRITKRTTSMRRPISARERLSITLRYLATGESQQSLSFSYRIGRTTVSNILSEVCKAIFDCLKGEYLRQPGTAEEWANISDQFEEQWNYPHVIGAIDGKHIRIECPKKSGSLYYNYKGFFSIVLLAVCDANYCFTLFDVGAYGSNNDSGVLANSEMGMRFAEQDYDLPKEEKLSGCNFGSLPYFLVGDEIFPLKPWMMRPFPGRCLPEDERIYNYRHSRARRTIKNTFGILAARWRILLRPIRASVKNVERYTCACLALHNYLRLTNNSSYTPSGFIDIESSDGTIKPGEWRAAKPTGSFEPIRPVRGSRPRDQCVKMRDSLKDYFSSSEGSVPWQKSYVNRTGEEEDKED
ncbi:putative nuclease HARBI1 [Clytia hemisphaerica]|uniref:putative nuclease HARBI1 n=1 Tax=Clytia hemisphaerica TaxID=252671 RepID=UPI0034D6E6F6